MVFSILMNIIIVVVKEGILLRVFVISNVIGVVIDRLVSEVFSCVGVLNK